MNKKIPYALLFLLSIIPMVHAQDFITFPNGNFIKAQIIEITVTDIKYKPFANPQSEVLSVPRNTVYNVRYENGTFDFLNGNTYIPGKSNGPAVNAATPLANTAPPATATTTATPPATPPAASATNNPPANNPAVQGIASNIAANQPAADATQYAQPAATQTSLLARTTATSAATTTVSSLPVGNTPFRRAKGYGTIFAAFYEEFSGILGYAETRLGKSDFGFGYEIGFEMREYSTYDYGYYDGYTTDYYTFTQFGLRASYHIPIVNKVIDPYLGVRGGFGYDEYTEEFEPILDYFVGGRLMFKNWGISTEYHFESGYSYIGLSFNW